MCATLAFFIILLAAGIIGKALGLSIQFDEKCCKNCKCIVENKKAAICSCSRCSCGEIKRNRF